MRFGSYACAYVYIIYIVIYINIFIYLFLYIYLIIIYIYTPWPQYTYTINLIRIHTRVYVHIYAHAQCNYNYVYIINIDLHCMRAHVHTCICRRLVPSTSEALRDDQWVRAVHIAHLECVLPWCSNSKTLIRVPYNLLYPGACFVDGKWGNSSHLARTRSGQHSLPKYQYRFLSSEQDAAGRPGP